MTAKNKDDEHVQLFAPAVGPNVEHEPPYRKGAPTDITDAAETKRAAKEAAAAEKEAARAVKERKDEPGATPATEATSPASKRSRRTKGGK